MGAIRENTCLVQLQPKFRPKQLQQLQAAKTTPQIHRQRNYQSVNFNFLPEKMPRVPSLIKLHVLRLPAFLPSLLTLLLRRSLR